MSKNAGVDYPDLSHQTLYIGILLPGVDDRGVNFGGRLLQEYR